MKKLLICLVLLLCLMGVIRQCRNEPIPRGIRMGLSMEDVLTITGGERCENTVITEDALYIFGSHGLISVILE